MESSAWRDANIYEKLFLSFCLAFDFVSGESTNSENEFWNLTLQAEKKVRQFLFEREITIPQQEEFIFTNLINLSFKTLLVNVFPPSIIIDPIPML